MGLLTLWSDRRELSEVTLLIKILFNINNNGIVGFKLILFYFTYYFTSSHQESY